MQLKYGWQLANNDITMYAMYIEDENGKMKFSKIWFIPNIEYLERHNGQNYIIDPNDKLKEMKQKITELKAQGKQVGTIITYLDENGKYTLKSKTYNSYKAFLRNAIG